ncbi:MAG: lipid-binding SYLF domain-containing protein [Syntrophorhabdaceae bacterium]
MTRYTRVILALCVLVLFTALAGPHNSQAASADEINRDAQAALQDLYAKAPSAKELAGKAVGILVFPYIAKGGFIVGGQFGEGVLMKKRKPAGYYNIVSLSYGLQAGVQKYGYAMFFMTDSAMGYLDRSNGWELGTGPSIVVVDTGAAGALTTTTAKSDVFAFFFDQKGLMGGIGLQGTKITKIKK